MTSLTRSQKNALKDRACLDQGAEHDAGAVFRASSQVRAGQRGKPTATYSDGICVNDWKFSKMTSMPVSAGQKLLWL